MPTKKSVMSYGCFLLIALISVPVLSSAAVAQENTTSSQTLNESTIEGTVASSTRQTFVVRTSDNQFYLFTFNRYTDKPKILPVGTRIRVDSRPGADTGTRLATKSHHLRSRIKISNALRAPMRRRFLSRFAMWRAT